MKRNFQLLLRKLSWKLFSRKLRNQYFVDTLRMEEKKKKKGKVVSIKGIQYEVVKEVLGTVILNQKGTARLYRMDDNNMFSLRSL